MTQHSNQDPSKAFAHAVALAKTGSAAAFEELRERYGITTAALVEHGAELSAQGDLLLQMEAQVRAARLSLMLVIQRDTIFDLCNRVTALEQLEAKRQAIITAVEAERAIEPNPMDELRAALRRTYEASSLYPKGFKSQGDTSL